MCIGDRYRELCRAVAVLRHIEPRTRDALVARGERLAASLLSAALVVAGRPATLGDPLDLVPTLSLIQISQPTRPYYTSYSVFFL